MPDLDDNNPIRFNALQLWSIAKVGGGSLAVETKHGTAIESFADEADAKTRLELFKKQASIGLEVRELKFSDLPFELSVKPSKILIAVFEDATEHSKGFFIEVSTKMLQLSPASVATDNDVALNWN